LLSCKESRRIQARHEQYSRGANVVERFRSVHVENATSTKSRASAERPILTFPGAPGYVPFAGTRACPTREWGHVMNSRDVYRVVAVGRDGSRVVIARSCGRAAAEKIMGLARHCPEYRVQIEPMSRKASRRLSMAR